MLWETYTITMYNFLVFGFDAGAKPALAALASNIGKRARSNSNELASMTEADIMFVTVALKPVCMH